MEKSSVLKVVELSGLPQDEATDFLAKAFTQRGLDFSKCNLEDLREVLADLLQDMILQDH